jgi:hypothetical protein
MTQTDPNNIPPAELRVALAELAAWIPAFIAGAHRSTGDWIPADILEIVRHEYGEMKWMYEDIRDEVGATVADWAVMYSTAVIIRDFARRVRRAHPTLARI